MNTNFPNLIAALDEAIAAMPQNMALIEHRNRLLTGSGPVADFGRLRLVANTFDPSRPPSDFAVAR